jgi:hypothetical protein
MALRLNGSTSGYVEIDAPAVAGDNTLTLPSTPNGSLVALDSSGRLGIGTNSPSNLLHIAGTGTDLTGLRIVNTQHQAAATSTAGLKLGITNSAGQRNCRIQAREEAVDSNAIALDFFTNSADAVDGETVKMTVLHSGNVGIGTQSPGTKLQVDGSWVSNYGTLNIAGPDNDLMGVGFRNTSTYLGGVFFRDGAAGDFLELNAQGSRAIRALTNGTERARIDSSGRLLVGTSTARTNINNESWSGNVALNVEGANAYGTAVNIVNNYNGNGYSFLNFLKSNTTSVGSNTLVSNGNTLGIITFQGNDGTEFVQAARIACEVEGTPGANDMPGRLMFSTTRDGQSSPTERMRLTADGTTLTFSAANGIVSGHSAAAGTSAQLFMGIHSRTSTTVGGTTSFQVYTNGNVQNTNNSYGAISDIKLKENIVDATSQWNDLKALQVRNYNFKEETGQQTHTQIGLVAQEAELVSPGLVSESPDRDEDGNDLGTVTKSVNYSVLYMKAVKALQEAMERIETLETKVAALEVTP